MMAIVLLILIPALTSLLALMGFSKLSYQSIFQKGFGRLLFILLSCFVAMTGAFIGLLISVKINKEVFDYKVLSEALPSGIYLWYGFGPGLTPHFSAYWNYTMLLVAMLILGFVYKSRRQSISV